MLVGFPRVLHTPQQDCVGTGGRTECKLIESQDLAASVQDALLRCLCEAESSDSEFRDHGLSDVIGDGANLDNDF